MRPPLPDQNAPAAEKCERRSLRQLAFNFDLSAMFLNYSVHHGKAETGSEIFRREKRIEHPGNILLLDPLTGIANGNA